MTLATCGVGALSFPIGLLLQRQGIIDHPNERSSHARPTARGGGVAIVLIVLGLGPATGMQQGNVSLVAGLLTTCAVLAVVSFLDDLRSLPAAVRFGCHALAAVAVLASLGWPKLALGVAQGRTFALPVAISALVIFLWISGYTNAFNFMDGINGLAAGQAVVTGLGMALLGSMASGQWPVVSPPVVLSLVIAGAALGFLPYNFPKARMFMGDVGSAPLGFMLASLVIWLARDFGWWLLLPLALLHANFVLDTGITLARRVARGERWHQAHREHFYQRLIRSGKSHAFVTLWEMALQGVVVGLMVAYVEAGTGLRAALAVGAIVVWLLFFAYCEVAFRRLPRAVPLRHERRT